MSAGNLNTAGQKGTNAVWQRYMLEMLKNVFTGYSLEVTQLLVKQALNSGSFYGNNANFVSGDSVVITDNIAHVVIAAPAANTFVYITSVLVTNSHATVGTLVTLQDGTGATIKGATGYAAPAGGGYTITFPTPIKAPDAAKGVYAICGTTGASVYVSVVGYTGS